VDSDHFAKVLISYLEEGIITHPHFAIFTNVLTLDKLILQLIISFKSFHQINTILSKFLIVVLGKLVN
jgi:hypothetical protein